MTDMDAITHPAEPNESPESALREVIGGALVAWMPLPSRLAVADSIVAELERRGLIAGAFEYAVRSETVNATFADVRAAVTFMQPGDGFERRTTAGPWLQLPL